MKLRLGTRGSKLATAQSELVARQLRELGHEVEIAIVRTTGDRTRASLGKVAGLGVFAAELRVKNAVRPESFRQRRTSP